MNTRCPCGAFTFSSDDCVYRMKFKILNLLPWLTAFTQWSIEAANSIIWMVLFSMLIIEIIKIL